MPNHTLPLEEVRQALWSGINIPDSEFPSTLSGERRGKFKNAIKETFIKLLHSYAHPAQTEAIVNLALRGKYKTYISLHSTVDHLYKGIYREYRPTDTSHGIGGRDAAYLTLDVLDEQNNLKLNAQGGLPIDPYFGRRIVHETFHVLDQNHPDHLPKDEKKIFGYSEQDPHYLKAHAAADFHARIMEKLHGIMERESSMNPSAAALEVLDKEYRTLRTHAMPATLRDYFDQKTGSDYPYLQELKRRAIADNPALSKLGPVRTYLAMLQQHYEKMGVGPDKFVEKLGAEIKHNVIYRITEIPYYPAYRRIIESIAKAADGIQFNIGDGAYSHADGRNPIAAMLMPDLERHFHDAIYVHMAEHNAIVCSTPEIRAAKVRLAAHPPAPSRPPLLASDPDYSIIKSDVQGLELAEKALRAAGGERSTHYHYGKSDEGEVILLVLKNTPEGQEGLKNVAKLTQSGAKPPSPSPQPVTTGYKIPDTVHIAPSTYKGSDDKTLASVVMTGCVDAIVEIKIKLDKVPLVEGQDYYYRRNVQNGTARLTLMGNDAQPVIDQIRKQGTIPEGRFAKAASNSRTTGTGTGR